MSSGRTRKVPVAGLTDGGLQSTLWKLDRMYEDLDLGVTFREADQAQI